MNAQPPNSAGDTDPDASMSVPATVPSRNPGGKACNNCARIKCKCVPRAGSTTCERCHRLNKECVSLPVMRRRGPKREAGINARSAGLEQKLHDLVSLLRAQHVPVTPPGESSTQQSSSGHVNAVPTHSSDFSATVSPESSCDVQINDLDPTEVNNSLRIFRDEMIRFSPYVLIAEDVTPLQLKQRYPFLWLNIMSVTLNSVRRRNSLRQQAKDIIIRKMVSDNERSLDLLLGILTFVNWMHLFSMDATFTCLASQLAVTLIHDLGLHMPQTESSVRFPVRLQIPGLPRSLMQRNERTMEERRAVLGAFVITSGISHVFNSADGLRWSKYLDEYLGHLITNTTVAQDKLLVMQVKMQLILNQAPPSPCLARMGEAPIAFVDVLRSQVDDIAMSARTAVPAIQNSSLIIELLYHFASLAIYQPILVTPPARRNEPDLKRYEMYQRCGESVEKWLSLFFSVPLETYTYMPGSLYSQLIFVVISLQRMAAVNDASWYPSVNGLDSLSTINRVIGTLEQLRTMTFLRAPNDDEHPSWAFGLEKFQGLKAAFQNQFTIGRRTENDTASVELAENLQGLPADFAFEYFDFNMFSNLGDNTF